MSQRTPTRLALALALAAAVVALRATPVLAEPAPASVVSRLVSAADPLAQPATFVLVGATGDLARRKILPALVELERAGRLPADFRVVAVGRNANTLDQITSGVRDLGKVDLADPAWQRLAAKLTVVPVSFDDPGSVASLKRELAAIDRKAGGGRARSRLFFLSVPPSAATGVVDGLADANLVGARGQGRRARLVVEKPFGRDLESGARLNAHLAERVGEERVLRMDHYVGKRGVLDLLAFRFVDRPLEGMWNRDHIARVRITAAEKLGIEGRAGFYEETGALRDFVQSHLMQVMSVVAMDEPAPGGDLREARRQVVGRLRPIRPRDVVRGQYDGYRDQPGVAAESSTETYVALTTEIAAPRWRGVPFTLETGKGLERKDSSIEIEFSSLSPEVAARLGVPQHSAARLVIEIDPAGGQDGEPPRGIHLEVAGRRFGAAELGATHSAPAGDAYARLIGAALGGETSLFVRADEVEASWRALAPVQQEFARSGRSGLVRYRLGVRRPAEGDALIEHGTRAPGKVRIAHGPVRRLVAPSSARHLRAVRAASRRTGAVPRTMRTPRAMKR